MISYVPQHSSLKTAKEQCSFSEIAVAPLRLDNTPVLLRQMKREIKTVNGTPNKRMYWSIISDYSLNTAICELVDNALDIWLKDGQKTHLKINIEVDVVGQVITILDCAGGIAAEESNANQSGCKQQ